MTALFLGVDIGTSSSKGVLAGADGLIVATTERPHQTSTPRPGWVEHDAEATWWADFTSISRELGARAGSELVGVCISGIGPCVLAADGGGRPLRPAILYGVDTRTTAEIAALNARYGEDAILARCGSRLSSQAGGAKLAWIAAHEPEVWERTKKFFMASSLAVFRLTGEYILDHHSASQCDPLYDMTDQAWIPEWCAEVAPGLEFPRLLWPSDVAGHVTAAAAAETGLPAGIPVASGTVDAWAEALSVGVRDPGDTMLMYGTTFFLVEMVEKPRPHPGLWNTAGFEPGVGSLAAGMATGGALAAWFHDVSTADYQTLDAEATAAGAGAGGLLALPYFAGERTPIFDPAARGALLGLTTAHGRGHIHRALLEAAGFAIRHNLEAMAEAGGASGRLVAVGGGTKTALWPQVITDITGVRQDIPRETIGAAYGDALMAAVAAGVADIGAAWNPILNTIEPSAANAGLYDELYGQYRALYPATVDIAHGLSRIQDILAATAVSKEL